MSGTSLDGADAALGRFLRGHAPHSVALAPRALRRPCAIASSLCAPAREPLDLAARGRRDGARDRLRDRGRRSSPAPAAARRSAAIGCHGQTVRHRPDRGFTIQLDDAARLAELTRHRRRRRLPPPRHGGRRPGRAAGPCLPRGGLPAPRSRARHREHRGISNVTWLPPRRGRSSDSTAVRATSCSTGGHAAHRRATFDEDGAGRRAALIDEALLERLLASRFLQSVPAEEHRPRALPPGLAEGACRAPTPARRAGDADRLHRARDPGCHRSVPPLPKFYLRVAVRATRTWSRASWRARPRAASTPRHARRPNGARGIDWRSRGSR